MTTLIQQFDKGVKHALHELRTRPGRYNFWETKVPRTSGSCGCIIGLIGEGAALPPGTRISQITSHFGMPCNADVELYHAMHKVSGTEDWTDDAGIAARFLKEAVARIRGYIPRGRRVS